MGEEQQFVWLVFRVSTPAIRECEHLIFVAKDKEQARQEIQKFQNKDQGIWAETETSLTYFDLKTKMNCGITWADKHKIGEAVE